MSARAMIPLYCSACGALIATCGHHADGGVRCQDCGAHVSIVVDCVGTHCTTVWPVARTEVVDEEAKP